jgi:hypothetical protein
MRDPVTEMLSVAGNKFSTDAQSPASSASLLLGTGVLSVCSQHYPVPPLQATAVDGGVKRTRKIWKQTYYPSHSLLRGESTRRRLGG